MLKLNMTICYLNFKLPKFELKNKLKSVEKKLKNIITQMCVKGTVDEAENNMKLDINKVRSMENRIFFTEHLLQTLK
jgi:hypothetical protein